MPKPAAPRHPVNHNHAHAPAAARTLMRHAVKKPDRPTKLRAQGQVTRATLAVTPKASAQRLDELRIRHARHIRHSQLISHFSAGAVYPVPVLQQPAPKPTRHHAVAASPAHHARKHVLHRKKPATTADLLQKALEQATSFRELPVK
jgi:hypothetical protein